MKEINYNEYFIDILCRLIIYNKKIKNKKIIINFKDIENIYYGNRKKNLKNYFIINQINLFFKILNEEMELTYENILLLHKILNNNILDKEKIGEFRGDFATIDYYFENGVILKEKLNKIDIKRELNKIIKNFNDKKKEKDTLDKKIKMISDFYVDFEKIHPFMDGNGRVGRFIILLQCKLLKIPFIILDEENKKVTGIFLNNKNKKNIYDECFDFFKYLVKKEKDKFKNIIFKE